MNLRKAIAWCLASISLLAWPAAAQVRVFQLQSTNEIKLTDFVVVDVYSPDATNNYRTKRIPWGVLKPLLGTNGWNAWDLITTITNTDTLPVAQYDGTNWIYRAMEVGDLWIAIQNTTLPLVLASNVTVLGNLGIAAHANMLLGTDANTNIVSSADGATLTNLAARFGAYAELYAESGTNFILNATGGALYNEIGATNHVNFAHVTNGPGALSVLIFPGGADRTVTIPTNWFLLSTNGLAPAGPRYAGTLTNGQVGWLSVWKRANGADQSNIVARLVLASPEASGGGGGSGSTEYVAAGSGIAITTNGSLFTVASTVTAGSSNITDSGYTAVLRNLDVSTNATFAGLVRSTNGFTSQGTNAIYSLATDASNYERYQLEPEDTRLTLRADTAGTGDDNLSVRIMPVGTGAFYLDNAGQTEGNARGSYAVDLQMYRGAANMVASGAYSFAANGYNIVSGDYASGFGAANTVSGAKSVVFGGQTSVSGDYSCAVGQGCSAAGAYALASGYAASAYLYGQRAFANNAAGGFGQESRLSMTVTSSGANQTNLWLNGLSVRSVIPANTSWTFYIQITARSTDAGTGDEESAAYEIKGLIERDNSAAATRLVGTPVVTELAEDDAAWTVSVSADTTNGALQINVTGNNETAVRWVATVQLTEVGG